MKRLAFCVRNTINLSLQQTVRGPKKKGQVQAKIQSNQIINIFKDRPDPDPLNVKQYPIYVQELGLGITSVHQLEYGCQLDLKYMTPYRPHYKGFMRRLKKQKFMEARQHKQIDRLRVEKHEQKNIHNRLAIYDLFRKSKEEEEEQQRLALEQQQRQQEEDDE